MRTTQPDVFAVGDCAEKRHFIIKRTIPIMLAFMATAEARIAAANLYTINITKSFSGTIRYLLDRGRRNLLCFGGHHGRGCEKASD